MNTVSRESYLCSEVLKDKNDKKPYSIQSKNDSEFILLRLENELLDALTEISERQGKDRDQLIRDILYLEVDAQKKLLPDY